MWADGSAGGDLRPTQWGKVRERERVGLGEEEKQMVYEEIVVHKI